MPRKRKGGGIARKRKGTIQGIYLHKSTITIENEPYKRRKNKRLGSCMPLKILNELEQYTRNPSEAKRVCYRMAIFYYYVEVLDAPHSVHWKGKGGTISIIRKALFMEAHQRRVIKRTLEEIKRCAVYGLEFNGKIEPKEKLGRKIIILPGSVEELLIANWMEAYCGFRQTTFMVNEHRR